MLNEYWRALLHELVLTFLKNHLQVTILCLCLGYVLVNLLLFFTMYVCMNVCLYTVAPRANKKGDMNMGWILHLAWLVALDGFIDSFPAIDFLFFLLHTAFLLGSDWINDQNRPHRHE